MSLDTALLIQTHQLGQAGVQLPIMLIVAIMMNINIHLHHHQVVHIIMHFVTDQVHVLGYMEDILPEVEDSGMAHLM